MRMAQSIVALSMGKEGMYVLSFLVLNHIRDILAQDTETA